MYGITSPTINIKREREGERQKGRERERERASNRDCEGEKLRWYEKKTKLLPNKTENDKGHWWYLI